MEQSIIAKEEVILTATQWWSDKLASRAPHSNGDRSAASMFACLFADMGTKPLTEDQRSIFEKVLAERLQSEYDDKIVNRKFSHFGLGTDYGPTLELAEAAQAAGINNLNFPFKTWMNIFKDHVEVSDGYGAAYTRI